MSEQRKRYSVLAPSKSPRTSGTLEDGNLSPSRAGTFSEAEEVSGFGDDILARRRRPAVAERPADILERCNGQTGYLTWRSANKAMSNLRFKSRRGRGTAKIYRCRFCQQWHFGHGKGE